MSSILQGRSWGGAVSIMGALWGRDRGLIILVSIVILVVVLVIGYLVAGVLRSNSLGDSPSAPAGVPESVTIWEGYQLALDAVRAQASDAQLASAATQWRSATEERILSGANTWSFVFYSQSRGSIFDVVVGKGSAQVVSETEIWHRPQTVTEGEWRKGPKDALLVFLACGGREFVDENPDAAVDLHLGMTDDGRSVWMIVGVGDRGSVPKALRIDVETGAVLLNSFESGG